MEQQSPRSGRGRGVSLQPRPLPLQRDGKGCQHHSSLTEGLCATGRRGKEPVESLVGGRMQTICFAQGRVAELKAAGKPEEPESCSLAGLGVGRGFQPGLLKDDFMK